MKEMILKIRSMPKQELKEFQKGRWHSAYNVSINDFKTYYKVNPIASLGDIIDTIKKDNREL